MPERSSTERPAAEQTASGESPDRDLERASALLYEVFGLERFRDTRYLEWFYREHPLGPAIEICEYDGDECVGHVGGIRMEWHREGEQLPFVFPLNLAVSEKARGRGLMTKVNSDCFEVAAEIYGDGGLVGMPNAASTRGYTGRLAFRLYCPLPTRVCPPVWPSLEHVESHAVDDAFLESARFDELVSTLDLDAPLHWSHRWTPELLRWRLRRPHAKYAVHVGRDLFVVTTVDRPGGVPVTVVLKALPRHRAWREQGPFTANAVIAAACRFHRSPAAIYAGFSGWTRVLGVRVPERFKPAPLNFICRSMRPGFLNPNAMVFETMEMLDFDAY